MYKLTYRTGAVASGRVEPVELPSLELADFRSCIGADKQPRLSVQFGVCGRTIACVDLLLRCNRAGLASAANGRAMFARETTT
jgi:hypothetical protein